MNEQRKAFEAWHNEKFRWVSKRDDITKHGYSDQRTQERWETWQAAIVFQAPRQALTDAEITKITAPFVGTAEARTSRNIGACRAIIAASGPNAALVAALKKIERNEQVVFDEDTNGDVIVSMDTDDMIEVARAALAAVGVEP